MNAEQTEIITIIPRVSASVSLACSSFVMLDVSGVLSRVICDQTLRKSKLNRVQPRLVFFMCMADFFASLMFVLGDVVFPTEYGGKGNIATCNAGGWFIQMIPAAALYNAFLALYYLLTIRYKKTEKQMVKFELWSHILIAIFWIGSGTVGVVLGLFNPAVSSVSLFCVSGSIFSISFFDLLPFFHCSSLIVGSLASQPFVAHPNYLAIAHTTASHQSLLNTTSITFGFMLHL